MPTEGNRRPRLRRTFFLFSSLSLSASAADPVWIASEISMIICKSQKENRRMASRWLRCIMWYWCLASRWLYCSVKCVGLWKGRRGYGGRGEGGRAERNEKKSRKKIDNFFFLFRSFIIIQSEMIRDKKKRKKNPYKPFLISHLTLAVNTPEKYILERFERITCPK